MTDLSQHISFVRYGERPLCKVLKIDEAPFARNKDPLRQLRYIERYVGDVGCSSVVVEGHYIDRDFMEDYSVFYSKSLHPYGNSCRRIHFFREDVDEVKKALRELIEIGCESDEGFYRRACKEFSDKCYLGFSVIKPLPGCPVGRTVLKCYDELSKKDSSVRRRFKGARGYRVHLLGVELTVRGLGFQQQDAGVSACATTAIWSSVQKTREFEDIGVATPAQITRLASQYTMPFGRAMPSEGLSVDQMCQAVEALGVSANLYRTDNYEYARGILHSASLSGMAPILIIEEVRGASRHAVTVAGIKVEAEHVATFNEQSVDDMSRDLIAAYVHDDRFGPGVRARVSECKESKRLKVGFEIKEDGVAEEWFLTHILIPMHAKVRVSFGALRGVASTLAKFVQSYGVIYLGLERPKVSFGTRVLRSHEYVEQLMFKRAVSAERLQSLCAKTVLPRYLGVVRMSADYIGEFDLLV